MGQGGKREEGHRMGRDITWNHWNRIKPDYGYLIFSRHIVE